MTTTNKLLEQPAAGSLNWDVPLNDNAGYIDAALGSSATITGTSGTITLATSQFRCMCLKSTALVFTADVTYVIPSGVGGQWIVKNQSASSAFNLIIKNAASSTSVAIANGQTRTVWSDGNGVFLSDDIDIATQAEAEAGTNNTALMTPLRTKQSITSEIATQAQAEAGTDNTVLMTPLRVEQAIESDIATQAQAQAGTDNTTLMTPLRTFQSTAAYVTTAYVQSKIAGGTLNAVGTYALLGADVTPINLSAGSNVAGSSLRYASLRLEYYSGGTSAAQFEFSSTSPSGTWKLMGQTFTTARNNFTSLFLRVA
jgi:hypothetical protein